MIQIMEIRYDSVEYVTSLFDAVLSYFVLFLQALLSLCCSLLGVTLLPAVVRNTLAEALLDNDMSTDEDIFV